MLLLQLYIQILFYVTAILNLCEVPYISFVQLSAFSLTSQRFCFLTHISHHSPVAIFYFLPHYFGIVPVHSLGGRAWSIYGTHDVRCEGLGQLCHRMTFSCQNVLFLSSHFTIHFWLIILKFTCFYFGCPTLMGFTFWAYNLNQFEFHGKWKLLL